MSVFPAVDPIPLPAPVWLFKTLHLLILSFHFTAIHLLIGGLFIALVWNLLGRRRGDPLFAEAAAMTAGYLPIIMTYLINLGVPPLLFTQLLYGRALYTGTVLIGGYWISVIFLLMALYFILYTIAKWSAQGRAWWGLALAALVIGGGIASIYSHTMTVMLRPEVWVAMFRANPHGTSLPPYDPTVLPRWLYMMAGSAAIAGVALTVVGLKKAADHPLRGFLVRRGGALAIAGVLVQIAAGFWAVLAQPAAVRAAVMGSGLYRIVAVVWLVCAAATAWLGFTATRRGETLSKKFSIRIAHAGFLLVAAGVVFRDGIRDAALRLSGLNVWDRIVVINPIVLGLFLFVFVAGVALMTWMCIVIVRASPATAGGGQ